ncbi:MAG: outer membrane protein assembly factor BamD [Gammaproteobacteria bacterium]|nr:MAG: outer membrane protein assembly factor BamD [Gammaproteobacteria bacterium]
MKHLKIIAFTVVCILFSACSDNPTREYDETYEWSAQKLYSEAKRMQNKSDYTTAIDYLNKLESRFPFSAYAQQALLEVPYLYYKDNEMELAALAADRFIKINPRHPSVDYAYYIKGLSYSHHGESFVTQLFKLSKAERSHESMKQAFLTFRTLVEKFPDSKYAPEASKQLVIMRDTLAEREIIVAKYYLRRKAHVGAINRAKHVIQHYPQTPAIYDALGVLAKCYKELEMDHMYQDTLKVIKLNYPDHEVLKKG